MRVSRKTIVVRMLLWFMPVFIVWKLLSMSILAPAIQQTGQFWISLVHSDVYPELVHEPLHQRWFIQSNLFVANSQWPDKTYKPGFKLNNKTKIETSDLLGYSLGLPLIWLLILSLYPKHLMHLLWGTLAVSANIAVAIFLLCSYKLISVVSTDRIFRVLENDVITTPVAWPVWLADVLKPFVDLGGSFAILILPMFYIIGLHLRTANSKGMP